MPSTTDRVPGNGFARLRDRYVRRAEYLANPTRKGGFWEFSAALDESRASWNELFPQYHISDRNLLGTLTENPWCPYPWSMLYWPPTLRDDATRQPPLTIMLSRVLEGDARRKMEETIRSAGFAEIAWLSRIKQMVQRFWPALDFANPTATGYGHPAMCYVSACHFSDPRLLDAESLFPPIDLQMDFLLHNPLIEKKREQAQAEGERDALRAALQTLLADKPDELADIIDQANTAGIARVQAECPLPDNADDDPWLFVPLMPEISANDIKNSAGRIASIATKLLAHRALSARVLAYIAEGCSQQATADRLGVSVDTVSDILTAIRDTSGK